MFARTPAPIRGGCGSIRRSAPQEYPDSRARPISNSPESVALLHAGGFMTPIVGIPSLCVPSRPPSPRGRRARRLTCGHTPRLAPVIGLALVVATVGRGEYATSPPAPETGPALDITPAQALTF